MRLSIYVVFMACITTGCQTDPRIPLDVAQHEINDVQAFQMQAQRLDPLQENLHKVLASNPRVKNPQVALYFTSSAARPYGARLTVEYVMLFDFDRSNLTFKDETEADRYIQGLVRQALLECGWDIEEVNTYNYEDHWRVRGQIRGAAKPVSAGAGLDVLPDKQPASAH